MVATKRPLENTNLMTYVTLLATAYAPYTFGDDDDEETTPHEDLENDLEAAAIDEDVLEVEE